jgi:hypothetical protein
MENTEKPANNVVHLRDFRDQEKTDDEFQEAPIFQCFVDEMKLSLHEQMDTHWQNWKIRAAKLPKNFDPDFPEDPEEAEELARVLTTQALLSLASNYASGLDREYESIFSGVGTAKDLFLSFYEQDMEDQYNE